MQEDELNVEEPVEETTDEKLAGRFLKDRSKQIGRDGAYLELDSQDLIERVDELEEAQFVILRDGRLDISDPGHVSALKGIMRMVADGAFDDDLGDMEPDQKSFYVFRRIFETGLISMADDCGL